LPKSALCLSSLQLDFFGIASIIHELLFLAPLAITRGSGGEARPRESMRKYWQVSLWDRLFATLLNGGDGIGQVRLAFERYLIENTIKAKGLNGALMKQEMRLAEMEM
jgi:checkpoint serine/threonine-protein kinase